MLTNRFIFIGIAAALWIMVLLVLGYKNAKGKVSNEAIVFYLISIWPYTFITIMLMVFVVR